MPYIDFFKSIKGIAVLVGLLLCLAFLFYRGCNKIMSEHENDNTEIIEIDVPLPSDYDRNCMQLTGKPCPKLSK